MTETLRDLSDYDPDPVDFAGLAGVTHKATEGTMPDADAMGTKLAARLNTARADGIPVLGAYHVLRTPGSPEPGGTAGTLAQQLSHWVARLDNQIPWWRAWPHWVMQIDAEKWAWDAVSPDLVLSFADLLVGAGLPGWNVTYASRGQYGDSLAGIATPLWNADYRGNGAYLGDAWTTSNGQPAGWAPYSGQVPALLQWNGSPDLNAYRGTVADFVNLATGGTTMAFLDDPNAAALAYRMDALHAGTDVVGGPYTGETMWTVDVLKDIQAKVTAMAAPVPVDTHALATDIVQQLETTGVVTASGIHDVVKQVLDAKLAAAQAA